MGSPVDMQILSALGAGKLMGKDKDRPAPMPGMEKPKEEDQRKRIASLGRLALVNTSPSGLLNPATTGRKKLSV